MQGRVLTIGGNLGQSKYSDAIPMKLYQGLSPGQKQAARLAGFANAMQSNQTFGIGRKAPQDIYLDPELQSLFLQGQIAGDISSIISAQSEMAIGGSMTAGGHALALAGAAGSATGVGLIVVVIGEGTAIVGEGMVLHGQSVMVVATANLIRSSVLLAATTHHDGNTAAAKSDGGGSGDGAQPNGEYEGADYHGSEGNSVKSAGPENGQQALNESIIVKQKANGSTRIATQGDKFVVLMEHMAGKFHGHVRTWSQLAPEMKNALIKAGKTNVKGKIIK